MKILTGVIVSKKMTNTSTVEVSRVVTHPVYKKRYKVTKKYHVHDEGDTKVGDTIKFVASKPYSKLKKWNVVNVNPEKKKKSVKRRSKK